MAADDNDKFRDIRAWMLRLDQRVDALEPHDDAPRSGRPAWQYQTVHDWVEDWFAAHFARGTLTTYRWCPRWWDHNEAVLYLTALWRSWERARRDSDEGIAKWLTHFAYPIVRELLDYDGTFSNCTSDYHSTPTPLVCEPDPENETA